MRKTVERELKLVPGEDFRLSDLGEPIESRTFVSTYHDTEDLRLARHGVTLRNRVEDGTRLWQLKLPSEGFRIELELPGSPRPPVEMTDLLVVHLRDGQALGKVARLRSRRQVVRRDGAEIVEDAVSVYEAQRVTKRFRELEIELVGGDEQTLARLERVLLRAGAERGSFTPKLYRALDLSLDEPAPTPPDAKAQEALGLALRAQHRSLLEHDPGTRLGADPEDLHQMRVATRRGRAFLRTAQPLLDREWAERLRAELGWLGSALGPARDADVLLEHMRKAVSSLGSVAEPAQRFLAALEKQHARTRKAAVSALSKPRYFALLDTLDAAGRPPLAEGPSATSLSELWWKEFRRTRREFALLDEQSADIELHVARIHVKRARYAAELAAHELGRPGERFVEAAKKLQDVLGEHQDSTVAEERIVGWAHERAGVDDVADVLLEYERKRRKKARRAWPAAWDRLVRRGRECRV